MSRAVLFCNGEIRDIEYHKNLLRKDDFVIAVDGGGSYCHRMGICPSVAIGDFDSLDCKIKENFEKKEVEIVPFPADKDFIDMVLGIEEAQKRGFDEILILGALGGKRADMFLGNAMALSLFHEDIIMENEYSRIFFMREGEERKIHGNINDYVSLIPMSDVLKTGKSDGLKYQLDQLVFHRGETRSISNELVSNIAVIRLIEGNSLVIIQKR